MATDAPPPPLDQPYQDSADYAWTANAFGLLERDELHGEVISRDGVTRSRVWGPCPRCDHALDDHQTHTAVTSLMSGEWRTRSTLRTSEPGDDDQDAVYFPVDVSCGCGHGHPGASAGKTGCGVSFRVELLVQPRVGQR